MFGMEPLDMQSWSRTELFRSYLGTDFPYINLGTRIEVGPFLDRCRKEGYSFYFALVHLATSVANEIENFHFRFRGDQAYRITTNIPVLTHMRPGDEIFMMLEGKDTADRLEFCRDLREKAETAPQGLRLDCGDRLDLISFSCIPWTDYTHIVRTISRWGVDCNPKITWGKYVTNHGKTTLNMTVQVHHGMMDGYHVGKFFMELQSRIYEGRF